ncbi:hypothetical protein BU15DRAFT_45276, partial [Melanogaster broomeanus]
WHGIYQRGSNWADGAAFVSRCPTEFLASNQAGTYWYHSHLSAQYGDCSRGQLVINDSSILTKICMTLMMHGPYTYQ